MTDTPPPAGSDTQPAPFNVPEVVAAPATSEEDAAVPANHLSLQAWFVEGLRAGVFLRPRVAGRTLSSL